jgi:hypothetical protein
MKIKKAAAELGVIPSTIDRLLDGDIIAGEQLTPGAGSTPGAKTGLPSTLRSTEKTIDSRRRNDNRVMCSAKNNLRTSTNATAAI